MHGSVTQTKQKRRGAKAEGSQGKCGGRLQRATAARDDREVCWVLCGGRLERATAARGNREVCWVLCGGRLERATAARGNREVCWVLCGGRLERATAARGNREVCWGGARNPGCKLHSAPLQRSVVPRAKFTAALHASWRCNGCRAGRCTLGY